MNLADATPEQRHIIEAANWFAKQHKCLAIILPPGDSGAIAVGQFAKTTMGVERLTSLITVAISVAGNFVKLAHPGDDHKQGEALAMLIQIALQRQHECDTIFQAFKD